MKNELETKVWNSVYDSSTLDLGSPDLARNRADQVIELMRLGEKWRRGKRWDDFWAKLGPILGYGVIVCVVVGGIFSAIYFPVTARSNDYAGIDPGRVQNRAGSMLFDWYGQDNRPPDLKYLGKEQSNIAGKRAWKVNYKDKTGKLVCAFVWGRHTDFYQVFEGSKCL